MKECAEIESIKELKYKQQIKELKQQINNKYLCFEI
jgi:hypothetical protein